MNFPDWNTLHQHLNPIVLRINDPRVNALLAQMERTDAHGVQFDQFTQMRQLIWQTCMEQTPDPDAPDKPWKKKKKKNRWDYCLNILQYMEAAQLYGIRPQEWAQFRQLIQPFEQELQPDTRQVLDELQQQQQIQDQDRFHRARRDLYWTCLGQGGPPGPGTDPNPCAYLEQAVRDALMFGINAIQPMDLHNILLGFQQMHRLFPNSGWDQREAAGRAQQQGQPFWDEVIQQIQLDCHPHTLPGGPLPPIPGQGGDQPPQPPAPHPPRPPNGLRPGPFSSYAYVCWIDICTW